MKASPTPTHPILAAVAGHLERYGWNGCIADHEMRMVWFSSEFWRLVGDAVESWHGIHYAEWSLSKEFRAVVSDRSVMRSGVELLPMLIDHTPGGREAMRAILTKIIGREAADIVDHVPDHQDPVWSTSIKVTTTEGMAPINISGLSVEIRDRNGVFVGSASVFFAPLPFRFVALLARGDERALERTARLTTPGRRSAAILFADLQSSGLLSRRLPSAVYFHAIRSLITAMDQVVVDGGGIVGRHAGDGLTAFFLSDDAGSASGAARSAIASAREIRAAIQRAAEEIETSTDGLVVAKECLVNVGVHWGGSLYMGQLNTGGRLEVTALGDAVNECARIQESARDGEILLSKALVENLDPEAASALGLDPDAVSYVSISQLAHASEKAIRDAGGIAVASL